MRMSRQGFTLVELMIVLAILGLLAGVGIPAYTQTLVRAKVAADTAVLASVQSALNAFMAETGWRPQAGTTPEQLSKLLPTEPIDSVVGSGQVLWTDFWADGSTLPVAEGSVKDVYSAGAVILTDASGQLEWGTAPPAGDGS